MQITSWKVSSSSYQVGYTTMDPLSSISSGLFRVDQLFGVGHSWWRGDAASGGKSFCEDVALWRLRVLRSGILTTLNAVLAVWACCVKRTCGEKFQDALSYNLTPAVLEGFSAELQGKYSSENTMCLFESPNTQLDRNRRLPMITSILARYI